MTIKPNLVIIIASDLRSDTLENPIVRTPHLTALRKDGVTFAQNCAANPVCAPSRIANFTGLYLSVNGHRSLYQRLFPHKENLFRILKENGYETVRTGKDDLMTTPSLHASFRRRLAGPQSVQIKLLCQCLRHLKLRKKLKMLALEFRLFVVERKPLSDLFGEERLQEFTDMLPSVRSPYSCYDLAQLTPEDLGELRATYYGRVTKLDEQVGVSLPPQGGGTLRRCAHSHPQRLRRLCGRLQIGGKVATGFQDDLLHKPLIVKYPACAHAGRRSPNRSIFFSLCWSRRVFKQSIAILSNRSLL